MSCYSTSLCLLSWYVKLKGPKGEVEEGFIRPFISNCRSDSLVKPEMLK